jgi:predicted AAA+ superfamily ATPase
MAEATYQRPQLRTLLTRLREPRRFIQVLAGPRQTGKTTLARQAMELSGVPVHYASADEPALRDRVWLEAQWDAARLLAREAGGGARC